ncbi:MAG: zinc ribbon domain-containing protein [Ruminococcaceae bacterium]|nr:zinc ribbon domain-containing protein [Oscillospiraceae bacterium]
MGGFTVDGCGATDKFYPIKGLGIYTCPNCGKQTEFTLDEVKRKISVFYIPTATVSVKYAIMCKKCERGSYITEDEKNAILYGNSTVSIDKDGIVVKSNNPKKTNTNKTTDSSKSNTHTDSKSSKSPSDSSTKNCPKCGAELPKEASFCYICGLNIKEYEEKQKEDEKAKKSYLCPSCGNELPENAMFCWKCGLNLDEAKGDDDSVSPPVEPEPIEPEPIEPEPIKPEPVNTNTVKSNTVVMPQKKYCPKCNMFYIKTKERCTICSGELILK